MRKIPLHDVQAEYFGILDEFFKSAFSEMKARGVITMGPVAEHLSSQDNILSAFQSEVGEFASGMFEFWGHYGPVVELHLKDLKCLKSVFGGDVFPSYSANIACSIGFLHGHRDLARSPPAHPRNGGGLGATRNMPAGYEARAVGLRLSGPGASEC